MKRFASFFARCTSLVLLVVGSILLRPGLAEAGSDAETRGHLSRADYEFAMTAAKGGILEAALGKIAEEKGTAPGVRQLGKQMAADHGKAGERLQKIAAAEEAVLPEKPTVRQEQKIDYFKSLRNEVFDREYVSLMIENHEKNLKVFQRTARKGENPALRNFAAETSVVIEGHLAAAKALTGEIRP